MRRREFCKHLIPAAATPLLLSAATLPRAATDILISMPDGRPPLHLSEFKGKVIAVEFLLTYCSHCQQASRATEVVYKQLASKGFQAIGAAINPGADSAAYARDHKLTFPVGTVSQDTCNWFLQVSRMQRLLLPQAAFIDRDFQIVEQHGGDVDKFFAENEEQNIRQLVERLLTAKK